jgi:hypothetical protein
MLLVCLYGLQGLKKSTRYNCFLIPEGWLLVFRAWYLNLLGTEQQSSVKDFTTLNVDLNLKFIIFFVCTVHFD